MALGMVGRGLGMMRPPRIRPAEFHGWNRHVRRSPLPPPITPHVLCVLAVVRAILVGEIDGSDSKFCIVAFVLKGTEPGLFRP